LTEHAKSGTFRSHEASPEATGVLLALVSSDKVVFVIHVVKLVSSDSESDNSLPKYLSNRRNMAVSRILEDVNNFMQIFEPALCDIDTQAQVLGT